MHHPFLLLFLVAIATNTVTSEVVTNEDTDWVLSDGGGNCDETCSRITNNENGQAASCNVHGMNQIDSDVKMRYVDNLLGGQCENVAGGLVFGNEPAFYISGGTGHCIHLNIGERTSCNVSFGSEQRYCCCGDNCPVALARPADADWVLSSPGANCNDACDVMGGTCDPQLTSTINTQERAAYVSSIFGDPCEEYIEGIVFFNEPAYYIHQGQSHCVYLRSDEMTECDVSFGSEQRFCCCGSNCGFSSDVSI